MSVVQPVASRNANSEVGVLSGWEGEPTLPDVGTTFLGFHLLAELGRGSFGCTYLARQGDLAGRLVALKVSSEILTESRRLAQLQHTHIVPVYSVHRAGSLQAVCMPFFGATTLADVLLDLGQSHSLPESGKRLVSTLNERRDRTHAALTAGSDRLADRRPRWPASEPTPPPRLSSGHADGGAGAAGPATSEPAGNDASVTLQMLEGLSYVDAVLWMGARLADGLAHAHERGILHRDLKPANILVADDGQPMLLDFNLAEDVKVAPAAVSQIGGTLPYMSPEHLAKFANLAPPWSAAGANRCVDERSDLYSLGVVLYELLTGRHPFTRRPGGLDECVGAMIRERLEAPPAIRPWNPSASPAVESIVRHCLEPDPAQRYRSAHELREDLERQLHHLPLRHAPEPSLEERLRKLARRHPRLTSSTSVGLVASVLLLSLVMALSIRSERLGRLEAVEATRLFHEDLAEVRLLTSGAAEDPQTVQEGRKLAWQALERIGFPAAVRGEAAPAEPLARDQLLALWQRRPLHRHLTDEEKARLQPEVGEMLLHLAWLPADPANLGESLRLNELAERCFPEDRQPRALWQQRVQLLRQLNRTAEARQCAVQAERTPLRGGSEEYLLGVDHLIQGHPDEAIRHLRAAVAEDPRNFAAWFRLGTSQLLTSASQRVNQSEAVEAFTVCIALRPRFAAAYLNRGLAQLRLDHASLAEADFTQALERRPGLTPALVLRAQARGALAQGTENGHLLREAIADLDRAETLGCRTPRLYFTRSRLKNQFGDNAGARRDQEAGLAQVPVDEEGYLTRGMIRLPTDPLGALADFEQAGQLNASSVVALQNQAHVLAEILHRNQEAQARLDQALVLDPESVPALIGRGVVQARLGNRPGALRDTRAALERAGCNGMVLFQAGGAYALTSLTHPGDREQAILLLARALQQGFGFDLLETDPDLEPLRTDRRFLELIRAAREVRARGHQHEDAAPGEPGLSATLPGI